MFCTELYYLVIFAIQTFQDSRSRDLGIGDFRSCPNETWHVRSGSLDRDICPTKGAKMCLRGKHETRVNAGAPGLRCLK